MVSSVVSVPITMLNDAISRCDHVPACGAGCGWVLWGREGVVGLWESGMWGTYRKLNYVDGSFFLGTANLTRSSGEFDAFVHRILYIKENNTSRHCLS